MDIHLTPIRLLTSLLLYSKLIPLRLPAPAFIITPTP